MILPGAFVGRVFDTVVVGAGPTGLACAIDGGRRGLDVLVVEKGTVVNTVVGYPADMTFFSTPELLEIGGHPFTPLGIRPKRVEAIHYYQGVVRAEALQLLLNCRVIAVEKGADGLFNVSTDRGPVRARTVVLSTGYFDTPNPLGVPGHDLPHVYYRYHEPYPFYGRDVLVIGGRNSAVEAALDLWRHGVRVTMVHRGAELGRGVKYWVRPDIENRIANREIPMHLNTVVESIHLDRVDLFSATTGERWSIPCAAVFAMIGHRPDVGLFDACGVAYDPETLIPRFNAATFETDRPGLYLAGSVICGCRTWEVFIENGRAHAAIVMEQIGASLQRNAVR